MAEHPTFAAEQIIVWENMKHTHTPQNTTTTKPGHTLIPKTDSKKHTHMVSISCIQSTSHYHDVHFDIK